MRMMKKIVFAFALWVAFFTATFGQSTALAATIYADAVNGSDASGDGSIGSPFGSLTVAMSSASPGDVVQLLPGLYDEAGNGEIFPVPMVPGVSLKGSGTLSTTVATTDDPALLFVYGNFDSSTVVEGLTILGLTEDTSDDESGIVIDAEPYGGYVTTMSPIIQNVVIDKFSYGVTVFTDGGYFPVNVSPVIRNNVIMGGEDGGGVFLDFGYPDTGTVSITNNLLDFGDEGDGYGVFAYAEGEFDSPVDAGAKITLDIRNNVMNRAYYGVYLEAGPGDEFTPGTKKEATAGLSAATTAGVIDATIVNNVINPNFANSGVGVQAFVNGDDNYGGEIALTIQRNEFHDYYGVKLYTEESATPDDGGTIEATIDGNQLLQTQAGPWEFGTGVYLYAEQSGQITATISDNVIEHVYGVRAEAAGSTEEADNTPDYSYGGSISLTVSNNELYSSATGYYGDTYGVYLSANGAEGAYYSGFFGTYSDPVYGPNSGGSIVATISDNEIDAAYGVEMFAEGAQGPRSYDGGGAYISAEVSRNEITALSEDQDGEGISVFASGSAAASNRSGSVVDLLAENNVIRSYDGVRMYQGSGSTAQYSADIDATFVNNTITGSGIGAGYGDGYAMIWYGGTAVNPFNPTIVNNILQTTSFGDGEAPVYVPSAAYNDPAEFDNNLVRSFNGNALTHFSGADQTTIGAVNALPFADLNITGNPEFVCPSQSNFNLLETSPAIDAGASVSFTPSDDILGQARPYGAGVDIGAFEFQGSVGPVFADVPQSNIFYKYITGLWNAGVTGGCSAGPPRLYCPDASVSREQMAVFIIRAMGELPNSNGAPLFLDVPPSSFAYGYIQRLAALGITGGCGGGLYCPLAPVTRAQMAAFLVRALGESPSACVSTFADVPPTNPFCGYIEKLAALGVTGGCGPGVYCPDMAVTRGQMAAFLVRAFNLGLPVSCNGIDPPRIAGPKDGLIEGALGVNDSLVSGPYGLAEAEAFVAGSAPASVPAGVTVTGGRSRAADATVHLNSAGIPEAADGSGSSGSGRSVLAGVSSQIGPVPNALLQIAPDRVANVLSDIRNRPAAGAALNGGGNTSVKPTTAQRQAIEDAVRFRLMEARYNGKQRIQRGIVHKQEKARILGLKSNPERKALMESRLIEKQERIARVGDKNARVAAAAARRAAWKAKLGPLFPEPGKRAKRAAPGATTNATSGRNR